MIRAAVLLRDACESYGACAKRTIKYLTCRRALSGGFTRGYVEQAFRRMVVRASLIHGPEIGPFLQRRDAKLVGPGRISVQQPGPWSSGPSDPSACEGRAGER
eukprot:6706191-Prymnesium_polylepis.1